MTKRNSLPRSISRGATLLGQWASTDHSGITAFLSRNVYYGFWNTLAYIVIALIIHLLGAIGTVAMAYAMIFYGLPWFLFGYLP